MKGIRRLGKITRVLARYGFGNVIERILRRGPAAGEDNIAGGRVGGSAFHSPVRIRRMLEELGPSFIKLGQLMSVRADRFPPQYIR